MLMRFGSDFDVEAPDWTYRLFYNDALLEVKKGQK